MANREAQVAFRITAALGQALLLIGVALFLDAPLQAQALSPAWVELGEGGQAITRIVVGAVTDCPALIADGKSMAMAPRLPAPAGLRVVCQATIPAGTTTASINGRVLPLPKPDPKRIVVIGDTGCRIKDERIQNCNDINKWPFLQIASDAAQDRPDLVIHVGDFLYRESPCPASSSKECGGTPNGDNWGAWNADFFTPSAKLLAAAPWAFARGNHESCARSWRGWFYYLDPRDWTGTCDDYSKPYVIKLGTFELAVLDSSAVKEDELDELQASTYAAQLASLHLENAWLVDHHPFWGFKANQATGPAIPLAVPLEEAWRRSDPKGIDLILSGHIHLFEFVTLDRRNPPQLVAGDGGTDLADPLPGSVNGIAVRGSSVTGSASQHQWGYTVLERQNRSWQLTLRSTSHKALVTCPVSEGPAMCQTTPKDVAGSN